MNPLHDIQERVADQIRSIPIVKNSIGDAGKIPVHVWRGSNLSNELEAALKNIGFGIIVKVKGFSQSNPLHWFGQIEIELNVNDMFNHGSHGKGIPGMDAAWEIAASLQDYQPAPTTGEFRNISAQVQESQKQHIEKILISARIEWTT